MRKFIIPLLMASVVMPAAASAEDRGSFVGAIRDRATAERSERSSEDRSQRADRPARAERSDRPVRVERSNVEDRAVRVERVERRQRVERPQIAEPQQVAEPAQIDSVERVRDGRRSRSNDNLIDGFRNAVRDQRDGRTVEDRRGSRDNWDGRRDRRVETGTTTRHRWSGDWRRDHRYDWRSYRDRNRSLFRIGRYYDPYGWNYRRFSIGFSLSPSYYGSNYWLNDPWMYRLPPAYGPYRWVRYYDDALLVNIYTGQVVDVLNNFFW